MRDIAIVDRRLSSRRRGRCAAAIAGLAIVMALLMPGCATPSDRAGSPTGGMEIDMYVRDATGAEMLYRVDRKGMLGFGGGLEARLSRTTWSGPLTEQEIQQLLEIVHVQNWRRGDFESTHQPPEHRYRVTIRSPEFQRRITLKGEHPAMQPARELLSKAALRRLEPDLQRLPTPSSQR